MVAEFSITRWFDSRAEARSLFLQHAGWLGAALTSVGEDCAFRRYIRLENDKGKRAILMEAVPDDHQRATPGHGLGDFIKIGGWLRSQNFHTPEIYAQDEASGYILMEDLGDQSFKRALLENETSHAIYGLAVDTLSALGRAQGFESLALPSYYESHVHQGRQRIVDWYLPLVRGGENENGLTEEYLSIWDGIEKSLPDCPQAFLHIDYHVENLMHLPELQGAQACGILDFQGAMVGPVPYDLANLLEDARIDVSEDVRSAMLARYTEGMATECKGAFMLWYRVLATQFHCRLMGQFIRLALKDRKQGYLKHLPRVAGYLEAGLSDPVLKPLKDWFAAQGVSEWSIPEINRASGDLIRDDAF